MDNKAHTKINRLIIKTSLTLAQSFTQLGFIMRDKISLNPPQQGEGSHDQVQRTSAWDARQKSD